jgi:hypothetical protein
MSRRKSSQCNFWRSWSFVDTNEPISHIIDRSYAGPTTSTTAAIDGRYHGGGRCGGFLSFSLRSGSGRRCSRSRFVLPSPSGHDYNKSH